MKINRQLDYTMHVHAFQSQIRIILRFPYAWKSLATPEKLWYNESVFQRL